MNLSSCKLTFGNCNHLYVNDKKSRAFKGIDFKKDRRQKNLFHVTLLRVRAQHLDNLDMLIDKEI